MTAIDSQQSAIGWGIQFATPDEGSSEVRDGTIFTLYDKSDRLLGSHKRFPSDHNPHFNGSDGVPLSVQVRRMKPILARDTR